MVQKDPAKQRYTSPELLFSCWDGSFVLCQSISTPEFTEEQIEFDLENSN